MQSLLLSLNFFIGSCLASHAAVIVDRWGKEDSVFKRSKCNNCGMELSILDEIPIISYFLLKGRCRFCQAQIPAQLIMIEVIGGLAFCKISFTQSEEILTGIMLFSLLLVAISDAEKLEFHLVMLMPAIFLALIKAWQTIFSYTIYDYLQLCPILLFLIFEVFSQKMGLGDLLIYLVLAFYFKPEFANLTFLTAAITLLITFFIDLKDYHQGQSFPFIPYLFLGLVIQLLCK